MKIVPIDFVMFQNFKDQIICVTFAVQKKLMRMLTVMAIGVGDMLHITHFSLTKAWTKDTAQNTPKHAVSSEKNHFSGSGLGLS